MKVIGIIREMTCTQTQLAKAIGVSQARVSQLIDEGIVIRDETATNGQVMLFESLQNYLLHKSGNTKSGINFNDEKALLMKAKRELAELKLAKAKGSLCSSADVEKLLTELFTTIRTQLTAIPALLAAQLEGQDRNAIYDILSSTIDEKLIALSQFDLSRINSDGDD